MRFFHLIPLVFTSSVVAHRQCEQWCSSHGAGSYNPKPDPHAYQKAGDGDSRSPCPFLNALANHDYLPRNGRDISIPQVLDACQQVYNVGPDVLGLFAKLGVVASPNISTFSLEDLKLHGCIETDASLSRADNSTGDNLHFNEEIYSTLANSNPGVDYYNTTSAAQVMVARLQHSTETNPDLVSNGKEINFRTTESALYLAVLGDPTQGQAPKKVVDVMFREERLPFAEGWRTPAQPITVEVVGGIAPAISSLLNFVPNNASYNGALPFTFAG